VSTSVYIGNVIRCSEAVCEHKHAASNHTYGSINGLLHKHNNIFHSFQCDIQPFLFIGCIFLRHFNTDFNYDKLTVKRFKIYSIYCNGYKLLGRLGPSCHMCHGPVHTQKTYVEVHIDTYYLGIISSFYIMLSLFCCTV